MQLRVREERYEPEAVLAMARDLKGVTGDEALLFVNGYPEVAVESGADGVHLPEAEEAVTRTDLPKGLLIGRSVHSVDAAMQAGQAGVDLLIAGAMFQTQSHPDVTPAGIGLIGDVRRAATVPVIGIGGIGPTNATRVMSAGADGIAVVGAVWGSHDPEAATRELYECIDGRLETS